MVKELNQKSRRNWTAELDSLQRFRCYKNVLYRDSGWDDALGEAYRKAKREFKQHMKYIEKEKASIGRCSDD